MFVNVWSADGAPILLLPARFLPPLPVYVNSSPRSYRRRFSSLDTQTQVKFHQFLFRSQNIWLGYYKLTWYLTVSTKIQCSLACSTPSSYITWSKDFILKLYNFQYPQMWLFSYYIYNQIIYRMLHGLEILLHLIQCY